MVDYIIDETSIQTEQRVRLRENTDFSANCTGVNRRFPLQVRGRLKHFVQETVFLLSKKYKALLYKHWFNITE